jgi:hypothetical protein
MCFWIQVWGYDIPTSAHSGTLISLTLFFSSVHILGTMYDSSLGVWETHLHTLVPFLKKKKKKKKKLHVHVVLKFWLT